MADILLNEIRKLEEERKARARRRGLLGGDSLSSPAALSLSSGGEGSNEPGNVFVRDGSSYSEPRDGSTTTSSSLSPPPAPPKQLPKGVVLGKDGKPCRSCTSFAAWTAMNRQNRGGPNSSNPTTTTATSTSTSTADALNNKNARPSSFFPSASAPPDQPPPTLPTLPPDCPPDVDTLGRHTWTFLHSLAAAYPDAPSPAHQRDMAHFLRLFARLYPCSVCAADLRAWMARAGNAPRTDSRVALGGWLCAAHNDVNRRLGKPLFDCRLWPQRWRDGWDDGRCD